MCIYIGIGVYIYNSRYLYIGNSSMLIHIRVRTRVEPADGGERVRG